MTEFSHSAPNRFRHERGLYFSSYAALQDWGLSDGAFGSGSRKRNPDPIYFHFDSALDPMSRVNEILETLIWLRGDVKPARHRVELQLRPEIMYPKYCIAKVSDDYDRLAMLTRIGVSCSPERNPDAPAADLVLTPTKSEIFPFRDSLHKLILRQRGNRRIHGTPAEKRNSAAREQNQSARGNL